MTTIIQSNTVYTLEIIITGINGVGVEGLGINYSINKSNDGLLMQQGTLISIGDGIYTRDIMLSNIGQYRVSYITPENYENSIETLLVRDYVDNDKVNSILANTLLILYELNILPTEHNISISEPICKNLKFDNEFTLLDIDGSSYAPILTIHYSDISIQCMIQEDNTEVRLEVSNDGTAWIEIYTFTSNDIKNIACYKYIRAQLVTGKAIIKGVAHKHL